MKNRDTKPPKNPETLCLNCDKDKCMTHTLYLYAFTHNNNPE